MTPWNVLVFPGGTEVGLEIQRSLRHSRQVRLFSAGLPGSSHAPYVLARHFDLPGVHDPSWLERLQQLVAEHGIHYIFPAHDDVLLALAENSHRLAARVVTSPAETCRIARSKSATYRLLDGVLPVPRLYPGADAVDCYPVFLKPDRGQGSQHTHLARTREEALRILGEGRGHLLLELLPGEEYTVDCFSDRERGLLFCGARLRVRTRNGIAMNSRPARDPAFERHARAIAAKLEFHGAWFFQLKRDRRGVLKLMEVAPRIAGTMALHRVVGVNFPLLSLFEQERLPVEILPNPVEVEIDRALANRYRHALDYKAVYVDLDDTLLLGGRVNTDLVRFLYQCVNRGIPIALLTRHAGDLDATLEAHRLRGLFDRQVHLPAAEAKAGFIREPGAILIDDSFRERSEAIRRGIPAFDCSMVEMLFDDRT
jgi:hypothetical protein